MFESNKIKALLIIFIILIFIQPAFALNNETTDVIEADIDNSIYAADIYVNASNTESGNGSIDNPYNSIENIKIEKDSIVHLTDGEYNYKSFRSLNNVTIIGQNINNTIIKCNKLEISSSNLILKNLTISGATFKNQGDFSAENVIFRNGVGHALDEYDNSYGGSIYTSYREDDEEFHSITLTNCYFINNTAEYGGAIYIDEGFLEINNCFFINNHAFNYGGAISAVNANKITIKKSKFENDFSTGDCGGAIYILSSTLVAENLDIINCSSTFGAAITGLNAKLDINKLYAFGNTAKYDGGVIYQMYGTSLITASDFINNSANNGGALFLDNVTSLLLISNKFINNSAKICAGAFYSISNKEYQNNGNSYENNHASVNNDIFNTSTINPIMKSSNYTVFEYVAQDDIILPSYYNLVDDGYVTPIKDQQDSGNCWSFAVLAALESCILKATNTTYDLSEENMKNLMASFSDYGWQIDVNEGGYDDMGIGYLVGWLGPVLESEDSFDDMSTLSPLLNPLLHIQNVVYLKRDNYLDNDAIKEAILKYGAVATGIYYSGLYLLGDSYYYYDTIMPSNHAVTIVGWDDTYSKYNFNRIPEGNGAFIVKNSWGTDWGDDGYFYVSYYDTKFAQVGKEEVSYTFILNDTMRYDKNYQYDISGKTDYLITGEDTIWFENIFTASDNEFLAAVSTYFNAVTNWDVSIYVNDVFKLTKSGRSPAGYYTINLGDLIPLHPGDIFKVMFKISCDGYANIPILESNYINKVPFSTGISYFSKDGENWIDLFNYSFSDFNHRYSSQLASIKAFTIFNSLNSTIKLDASDKGVQSANIKAKVCDQYGNLINSGKVIFTIEGVDYTVNVTKGMANITHIFKNKSLSVISARFTSESYNSSSDECSIEFFDANMIVNIKDIQYGDNLIMNLALIDSENNLLSDIVNLTVNNRSYEIGVNGNKSYELPFLFGIGQYEINLKCGDVLNRNVSVNVSKANIGLDVVFNEKRENLTININFSKPINESVTISVSGKNYTLNASGGMVSLFLDDLDYGSHEIIVSFTNKNYESVYKNYTIQTNVYKSKLAFVELKYVNDGLLCIVNLSKFNNAPIADKLITFSVNELTYENATDSEGNVCFKFNIINGNYPIRVSFDGYDDIVGSVLNENLIVNRTPIVIQDVNYSSVVKIFDEEYMSLTFSDNANGDLIVLIDGNEYYNDYFTLDQLNVSLSGLTIGNHEINVTYSGIEGYYYSKIFKVSVTKSDFRVSITYDMLYVGKTAVITFNLPTDAKGYIFADIGGNSYYAMIKDGKAVFQVDNLPFGESLLSYTYDGDSNYLPLTGSDLVNVKHFASLTGNKDVSMSYSDGSSYKVRVLGPNKEALTSGYVTFTIGGNSYKVNVDKSGWASLKITLKPKNYVITASYDGVKVSNKVSVKSILKLNTNKIKKSAKKVTVKVTLSKINGKYLKGKKVTFKFNGKKYMAKTDKKGVAKITINKKVVKKLKVNKKYSIQISYLKDTVKKTILVKK